jgi:hypothetical protein
MAAMAETLKKIKKRKRFEKQETKESEKERENKIDEMVAMEFGHQRGAFDFWCFLWVSDLLFMLWYW